MEEQRRSSRTRRRPVERALRRLLQRRDQPSPSRSSCSGFRPRRSPQRSGRTPCAPSARQSRPRRSSARRARGTRRSMSALPPPASVTSSSWSVAATTQSMHTGAQWSIPLWRTIEYAGQLLHGRDRSRARHEGLPRRLRRRERRRSRRSRWPVHRARRPVGLRTDAAADDRRPRGGDRGHWKTSIGEADVIERAPRHRHRDGLGELRAYPHDRSAEPRLRPQGDEEGRDSQARRRSRRDARARSPARAKPRLAVSGSASPWDARSRESQRRSSWTSRPTSTRSSA